MQKIILQTELTVDECKTRIKDAITKSAVLSDELIDKWTSGEIEIPDDDYSISSGFRFKIRGSKLWLAVPNSSSRGNYYSPVFRGRIIEDRLKGCTRIEGTISDGTTNQIGNFLLCIWLAILTVPVFFGIAPDEPWLFIVIPLVWYVVIKLMKLSTKNSIKNGSGLVKFLTKVLHAKRVRSESQRAA